MTIVESIPFSLKQEYYDFFSPFISDLDVIDLHLVEFISLRDRENFHSPFFQGATYGKSYSDFIVDYFFRDLRYESSLKPSQVSRNSILLADKAIQREVNRVKKMNKNGGNLFAKERLSSLLAHELGHIVLEKQRPSGNDVFHDHYCIEQNDYCTDENVMTSGGANNLIFYKDEKLKDIYGYSELPKIQKAQCESLKNHPLIQTID